MQEYTVNHKFWLGIIRNKGNTRLCQSPSLLVSGFSSRPQRENFPLRQIYIRNHERFSLMAVNQAQLRHMKCDLRCFDPIQIQIKTMITAVLYCVRGTRKQLLIVLGVFCIIGCPVQLIREVFSRLHSSSSSSTHICLALRRLLRFCLTLTR